MFVHVSAGTVDVSPCGCKDEKVYFESDKYKIELKRICGFFYKENSQKLKGLKLHESNLEICEKMFICFFSSIFCVFYKYKDLLKLYRPLFTYFNLCKLDVYQLGFADLHLIPDFFKYYQQLGNHVFL